MMSIENSHGSDPLIAVVCWTCPEDDAMDLAQDQDRASCLLTG